MIRFIDLGKQIAVDESDPEWHRQFAFFNTIDDHFLEFNGEQVWESWAEFSAAYQGHYKPDPEHLARLKYDPFTTNQEQEYVGREFMRFRGLCPAWAFEASI